MIFCDEVRKNVRENSMFVSINLIEKDVDDEILSRIKG
jgi:hypothetical protein